MNGEFFVTDFCSTCLEKSFNSSVSNLKSSELSNKIELSTFDICASSVYTTIVIDFTFYNVI